MKRKQNLQLFAAPDNLTDAAAIDVKAREIDFVTSFTRNLTALTEILGITNKIKKPNGAMLTTKKATGALQSGVVTEGDEIPLSKYTVTETPLEKIVIEKYKKAVSIEAIAEKGYDAAVDLTDEEFKVDLQNKIVADFHAVLKTGTLTSTETTWQMGVAMAIGNVKDKFKKIHRSVTGVAVFVNTLDAYKFLGAANISTQTAFGMEYIKNFLGADVVFLSSEIDRNTVLATPLNNIVCYYVDPADAEFARAGLVYTTDSESGLIGFCLRADYDRALSAEYALMGIKMIPEYLDGIAKITVTGA